MDNIEIKSFNEKNNLHIKKQIISLIVSLIVIMSLLITFVCPKIYLSLKYDKPYNAYRLETLSFSKWTYLDTKNDKSVNVFLSGVKLTDDAQNAELNSIIKTDLQNNFDNRVDGIVFYGKTDYNFSLDNLTHKDIISLLKNGEFLNIYLKIDDIISLEDNDKLSKSVFDELNGKFSEEYGNDVAYTVSLHDDEFTKDDYNKYGLSVSNTEIILRDSEKHNRFLSHSYN